jgi:hypothetical protein
VAELPELRKRTGGFVWLDIPEWSEEAEAVLTDDLSESTALIHRWCPSGPRTRPNHCCPLLDPPVELAAG